MKEDKDQEFNLICVVFYALTTLHIRKLINHKIKKFKKKDIEHIYLSIVYKLLLHSFTSNQFKEI